MKILGHQELGPPHGAFEVHRIGGPNDGEVFRLVQASFDNGQSAMLFVSDSRPGYFRQVFVPWDFEHPAIADT
jgi:hypothetical protein